MKVFSLRLRSQGLRELIREVAASEHISQNELIEQAVAHEVLLRGATLGDDLERAAQRIGDLTHADSDRTNSGRDRTVRFGARPGAAPFDE